MRVILSNLAQLDTTNQSYETINCVENDLTLTNPQLIKRINLNLSLYNICPSIKLFLTQPDTMFVPIGYVEQLSKHLPAGEPLEIVDQRTAGNYADIDFKSTLRQYQLEALAPLEKRSIGVISAPTGSGKSVMMCWLIAEKKVQTLVLVNTLELANQFKENLLRHTSLTDADVAIISSGAKFALKPVTITLLQSANKFDEFKVEEINKNVGMVLTDEVHIVGASTYYEVLNKFSAHYKYGFSATPEREDGLTPLIHMASGPIRSIVSAADVAAAGNILLPQVRAISTNYTFPLFDMNEYQTMITDLANDSDRNQLIADTLAEEDYATKQKVLLCGRVIQCVHLQQLIPESKILVGSISAEDQEAIKKHYPDQYEKIVEQKGKKYRKKVVEELSSGKLNTVISTYSLFSTGLDFSGLEVAAFCSPLKSKILVKQCRGRIMRVAKNKQPICLDFEDSKVGLLKTQSKTRQRILKRF